MSINSRSSSQSVSCRYVCLVHQVIVHEVPGQELEVEVYDKDTDKDDFLGRYIQSSCLLCTYVESPFILSFMARRIEINDFHIL